LPGERRACRHTSCRSVVLGIVISVVWCVVPSSNIADDAPKVDLADSAFVRSEGTRADASSPPGARRITCRAHRHEALRHFPVDGEMELTSGGRQDHWKQLGEQDLASPSPICTRSHAAVLSEGTMGEKSAANASSNRTRQGHYAAAISVCPCILDIEGPGARVAQSFSGKLSSSGCQWSMNPLVQDVGRPVWRAHWRF